jgi:DNA replication protein DnaC
MWAYRREPCACEREEDRVAEEMRKEDEAKQRRIYIAHIRESSGLVGKLADMRLEGFKPSRHTQSAYDWAVKYLDSWPVKTGGLLIGPFGSGKTHLSAAVANALIDMGVKVKFMAGFDLLERIRRSYDKPAADGPDVCESVASAEVLVYDDLGNERIASDDRGEWAREKILRVFYWRDVHQRPTIVTSNYTKGELGAKIGFATLSRILGLCGEPIVMPADTPDYRVRRVA